MDITALLNPGSAAIVLGGTLIATVLRAGTADLKATGRLIVKLFIAPFEYNTARAQIAAQVEDIRHHGVLRAQPGRSTDNEISEATDALIRHRSIRAAMEEHDRYKRKRIARLDRALDTLYCAADLAPIFGLAGTLLALAQLPAGGLAQADLMGAIGMAVVSTLYGLLTAHLVLMPLASLIARHANAEETERQRLFDWLETQLADACPDRAPSMDRAA